MTMLRAGSIARRMRDRFDIDPRRSVLPVVGSKLQFRHARRELIAKGRRPCFHALIGAGRHGELEICVSEVRVGRYVRQLLLDSHGLLLCMLSLPLSGFTRTASRLLGSLLGNPGLHGRERQIHFRKHLGFFRISRMQPAPHFGGPVLDRGRLKRTLCAGIYPEVRAALPRVMLEGS